MKRSDTLRTTSRGAAALGLLIILAVIVGVIGSVVIMFPGVWLVVYVGVAALFAILVAVVAAALFSRFPK